MHLKMIVYLLPAWNLSIQEFCIHKDLQDPINSIKIENSAKTTKEIMILSQVQMLDIHPMVIWG